LRYGCRGMDAPGCELFDIFLTILFLQAYFLTVGLILYASRKRCTRRDLTVRREGA